MRMCGESVQTERELKKKQRQDKEGVGESRALNCAFVPFPAHLSLKTKPFSALTFKCRPSSDQKVLHSGCLAPFIPLCITALLGVTFRIFLCAPGHSKRGGLMLFWFFFFFFTSVSFHLSPEVMTVLICSQAINSREQGEPIPTSASSLGAHVCHIIILSSLSPYLSLCWFSDDDCTNSFTPNQMARMHCYLDLVYQSWQPVKKPAPIAIAPQIVDRTSNSITLEWFPPVDGHFFER